MSSVNEQSSGPGIPFEMGPEEFREFGRAAVEFIANYMETIRERDVLPSVEPGYLRPLLPEECPQQPEPWQDIMKDMERHILPGITHWQSPSFAAFFPTASSFPAIIGEMLSAGLGVLGFSWMTSPVCTELEVVVMDWLGKMLGMPKEFLHCSGGPGGGVIQGSASEATLVAMLAAREKAVRIAKEEMPHLSESDIRGRLVAYTSDQANSSVWKAGPLGAVPMKQLPTDSEGSLRGAVLQEAIQSDKQKGLIPCYLVATLGTTGTCAMDNLEELGPICNREKLWLHIDAAYAGAALVCPEYQHLLAGVHYADSFDVNLHKWMLVNFDCSAMWLKDSNDLTRSFNVDAIYLPYKQGVMPDYRHWQLPLGRRFRALKLWIVLRSYGVRGLQEHVRTHVRLAREFERLVREDARFEVAVPARFGLVGFRMKGPCARTKQLLERVTARKKLFMCPATVHGKTFLRYVLCSRLTELKDVKNSWAELTSQAALVLQDDPSNGVHHTNGVDKANGVGHTNGVSKTNGVEKTNGVSKTNGVEKTNGVTKTNGVEKTNGVTKTNGVEKANGGPRHQSLSSENGATRGNGLHHPAGKHPGYAMSHEDHPGGNNGLQSAQEELDDDAHLHKNGNGCHVAQKGNKKVVCMVNAADQPVSRPVI